MPNWRTTPLGLPAGLLALATLAAACTGAAGGRAVDPVSPSATGHDSEANAQAVVAGTPYLFGQGKPPVDIQPGSAELLKKVPQISGLHSAALKSTNEAAAIFLLEDDPKVDWGTHLNAAEPAIFRAFAANQSMGRWLILMTDVAVHALADPINPTAYLWRRADVQRYAQCGIPDSGSNDCKTEFFRVAVVAMIVDGHVTHPNQ